MVSVVGVDEAGKSTLIRELKEKYPDKIDVLAFPTLPLREKLATLTIDYTDIHSILNYHMRFQLDFSEQQDKVAQYKENDDKLLILDRYIYCSLAYLCNAVLKYHSPSYWRKHIRPILWGYYEQDLFFRKFVSPDYIIWLYREEVEDDEHNMIQKCYREELSDWMEYCDMNHKVPYYRISALQQDTFARVERALLDKGFI